MRTWQIAKKIDDELKTKFPDFSPVILQLLSNRGLVEAEAVRKFLEPRYEDLLDPGLFNEMAKFLARVRQALSKKEKVFVYGDYDADGVCSSVLLVETLRKIGLETSVYLPHREKEGYGLNAAAIEQLKNQHANLIITVDCASGNAEEVALAKKLGLDVMILDHHEEPPVLPVGLSAFLNPHLGSEKYPFKNLAAVGVVFKAVQALWREFGLEAGQEKWFLDLVAMATIADMMPLAGENRVFVKFGLKVLNRTKRLGLEELILAAGLEKGAIDVYDVGFKLAPRVNAAGRLGHANAAFELFATADQPEAAALAASLNETNSARQTETDRMLKAAMIQIKGQLDKNIVLMAFAEDWSPGVVGLVSGRVTDRTYRPSFIVTESRGQLVGSGRSIPGFNITEALRAASSHLLKFGGHDGACGFTLKSRESLVPFLADINKIARARLTEEQLKRKLVIDASLDFKNIDWDLLADLEKLAPYGIGNSRPIFASHAVRVESASAIGADNSHLRLAFSQNNRTLAAVFFGSAVEWGEKLAPGSLVDIAYDLNINEWNGRRDIQLKIVDIKDN